MAGFEPLQELEPIAYAKKNPGKVDFAESGLASNGRLATKRFMCQASLTSAQARSRRHSSAANADHAGRPRHCDNGTAPCRCRRQTHPCASAHPPLSVMRTTGRAQQLTCRSIDHLVTNFIDFLSGMSIANSAVQKKTSSSTLVLTEPSTEL